MKKNSLNGFLALCFFAAFSLLATSCPNSADDSYTPPAQTQQAAPSSPAAPATTVPAGGTEAAQEIQYITFKGSVQAAGAMPASYAKAVDDLFSQSPAASAIEGGDLDGVARSASPNVTVEEGGDLEFFATATAREDGTVVNGYFESAASSDFEMALSVGKTWDIVCGVRKKSDSKVVLQDTYSKQVTVEDSVLKHNFELLPAQEGSGSVELTVNFSTPVAKVEARWENAYAGVPALTLNPTDGKPSPVTISAGDAASASGVPSGNYNIVLSFKDANNISLYESVQTVTVMNGMPTNAWTLESGEGAISQPGDFVQFSVGSDLIKSRESGCIYVGVPADLVAQGVTASATNKGGAYSPLNSLDAAFKKIKSLGNKDKDFQIFVSGEVSGNSTIDSDITASANAKSITIQGLDGFDAGGNPKAGTLKGTAQTSVITVSTSVPVIFKNIKITGGKATSASSKDGGGINMTAGADVTIDQGVEITGNIATISGGGVCNRGGALKMKGGKIYGNSITYSEYQYDLGGVGVFVGGTATFDMTGGEISENTGTHSSVNGGGVKLRNGSGGNAVFTMSGGKITKNKTAAEGASIYSDGGKIIIKGSAEISGGEITKTGGAWGAAIALNGGARVEMSGGTISGHRTAGGSAGVYVPGGTSFIMTGGQISENQVTGTDKSGGAVMVKGNGNFTIGGSAKIPYGVTSDNTIIKGAGNNDVYVEKGSESYSLVTVASGGFSYSGTAATITAQGWQRGFKILKASSGNIDSYKNSFALTDGDFNFTKNSEDASVANLKAPLYVSKTGGDDASHSGTKEHPYHTIAYAAKQLGGAEPDTIYVDGTLEEPQSLPEADYNFNKNKCSALTIKGANHLDASGRPINERPTDAIDAKDAGIALTIVAPSSGDPVPITIENLKITGGNTKDKQSSSTAYGGGITVSAGSLTLSDAAWITKNKGAGSIGTAGGVGVAPGAMLFMRGKALVGTKDMSSAPDSQIACLNAGGNAIGSGPMGAGILNMGSTFIGCDEDGNATDACKLADGYGVIGNWAQQYGGGIANEGTLKIGSGEISRNMAHNVGSGNGVGGGVYQYKESGTAPEFFICGGKIRANKATYGGGVYIETGTVQMSGGAIGGSTTEDGNVASSTSFGDYNGGGVFIHFAPSGSTARTFTMTGGTVAYNQAKTKGGGVYLMPVTNQTQTLSIFIMKGGTIENNSVVSDDGKGGAVCSSGSFQLSDYAYIPSGVGGTTGQGKNDVSFEDGKAFYISAALTPTANGTSTGDSKTVAVEAFTPSTWTRGTTVLQAPNEGVASSAIGKIKLLDDKDEWNVVANPNNAKYGVINAEIWVAGGTTSSDVGSNVTGGKAPSNSNRGTKSQPYADIATGVAACWDSADTKTKPFTINIDGTLSGAQTIGGSGVTINAGSLTLKGYKTTGSSAATLNGGFGSTSNGTTLSVGSDTTVTIQDLTITGGYAAETGGGISVASGAVNLADGAVVKGNYASTYGGGVYVAAGAYFAAYGTSVIGSSDAADASSADTDLSTGVNKANKGGGGIYNEGTICFGKAINKSGTESGTANWSTNWTGGLLGNVAENNSGGAVHTIGEMNLYAGNIKFNYAKMNGGAIYDNSSSVAMSNGTIYKNKADGQGGAVFIAEGKKLTMSSGTISGNSAGTYAGAVRVYKSATFEMTGGTIGGKAPDGTTDAPNTAANPGGAVYVDPEATKFSMSDGAKIPYVAAKKNDVYFPQSGTKRSKLTVSSALTTSNAVTLDFPEAEKGMNVVSGATTNVALVSDWDSFTINSSGNLALKNVITTLYVNPANTSYAPESNYDKASTWKHYNSKANTGNYSSDHPFKTLDAALQFLTWQAVKTDYTIQITGTLTGAQTLPESDTNKKITLSAASSGGTASSITLKGADANAKLNGGFGSGQSGRPLTIQTDVPITIQSLTITGGNTGYGGGIYVGKKGAKLTLTTGAKVTGNTATSSSYGGGGIYIVGTSAGRANLIMNSDSQIYGNEARSSTNTVKGGGVYLSYANLCMSGTAIVGAYQGAGTSSAQSSSGQHSNYAYNNGGGVYCDENSAVWLGYSEAASNKTSSLTAGYGIVYNYSGSGFGGGIYCLGEIHMASGSVSNNGTSNTHGGGVYLYADESSSASMEMSGGALSYNASVFYGGGIYVKGASSLSLSGTGTTLASNTVIGSSAYGGGIYLESDSSFSIKDSPSISSSGAKNNDVYLCKSTSSNAAVTMAGNVTGGGLKLTLEVGEEWALSRVIKPSSGDTLPTGSSYFALTNTSSYKINSKGYILYKDVTRTVDVSTAAELKNACSALSSGDSLSLQVTSQITPAAGGLDVPTGATLTLKRSTNIDADVNSSSTRYMLSLNNITVGSATSGTLVLDGGSSSGFKCYSALVCGGGSLYNVTIKNCDSSKDGYSGANPGNAGKGGAVRLNASDVLYLYSCTISSCSATNGGAIYALGEVHLDNNCSISSCYASTYGGALYLNAAPNNSTKNGEIGASIIGCSCGNANGGARIFATGYTGATYNFTYNGTSYAASMTETIVLE